MDVTFFESKWFFDTPLQRENGYEDSLFELGSTIFDKPDQSTNLVQPFFDTLISLESENSDLKVGQPTLMPKQGIEARTETDSKGEEPPELLVYSRKKQIQGKRDIIIVQNQKSDPSPDLNATDSSTPAHKSPSGGLMEEDTVGPKGMIRRSEFVAAIAKALRSLGYVQSGEALERESGLDSHLTMEEAFKKQVLAGSWKVSVDTLHKLVPKDECIRKRASFLIFEQNFFELLAQNSMHDALETLRSEITPLNIYEKRVNELSFCMLSPTQPANPRSKLLEELQKLLTPNVLILGGRLVHLVEQTLIRQRELCHFHNSLDKTLSLYTDHVCGVEQIPSRTIQVLQGHDDGVLYLQFSNNGKYLASSSMDKSVIIWEVHEDGGHFSLKHKLSDHHQTHVVMVAWSPDDQHLLSCGEREEVRRWDVTSGECLCVYEKSNTGLISCGWLLNGEGIFAATTDYGIYCWLDDGGYGLYHQGKGTTGILDTAITKDGKTIITIEDDKSLLLCNLETTIDKLIKEEEEITSFSLSCDDKSLLVNLINGEIHLWNIEEDEPKCRMAYKGHKNYDSLVRSCFGGSQEGFIASGSKDSQVYIWQRDLGDLIYKLPGHLATVYCVSWNPVNPFILASASADCTIRIWGSVSPSGGLMEEGTVGPKGIIRRYEFVAAIAKALRSLGYVQSGEALERESGPDSHLAMEEAFKKQMLAGSWKESVDTLHKLAPKDECICKHASFLIFEQKFFELLVQNSNVKDFDALKTLRTEITPLNINKKRVHELSVCVISPTQPANPRSKLLVELLKMLTPTVLIPEGRLEHLVEQALILQRDQIPSKTIQILRGHYREVNYLKFSNNGKYLASSSADKYVVIWEVHEDGHLSLKHKLSGHQTDVMMVAWSPNDNQLLSCGLKEVVRRWDVTSGECLRTYQKGGIEMLSCCWFPDDQWLLTSATNNHIYKWDLEGEECIMYLQGGCVHNNLDMGITNNGKNMITMQGQDMILFHNIETGVDTITGEGFLVISLSLSRDGNFLLVNLINGFIHLWKIEGKPEHLRTYGRCRSGAHFSRSCLGGSLQNFVASGCYDDSKVYIWHRDSEDLICILPGHSAEVNCVSWNPVNPFMFASASDDFTIRIWGLAE